MKLRNGKNIEKRNQPSLIRNTKIYPPVQPQLNLEKKYIKKTIEVRDFIIDLKAMIQDLNKLKVTQFRIEDAQSVTPSSHITAHNADILKVQRYKTAKIAGIADIYDFILEYGRELKDVPLLERFFAEVKYKIPEHLGELIEISFTYMNDDKTATNIKKARNSILAVNLMLK